MKSIVTKRKVEFWAGRRRSRIILWIIYLRNSNARNRKVLFEGKLYVIIHINIMCRLLKISHYVVAPSQVMMSIPLT